MTVLPFAQTLRLLAIVVAAGTFATRAACYAELSWLARFGRGAVAMTVIMSVAGRIGKTGATRSAAGPAKAPQAPTAQRQWAAIDGHEMKTPLTGIKAYLELLSDGEADDEPTRREFLSGIGSQVDRLERTVDELLIATDTRDAGGSSPAATRCV